MSIHVSYPAQWQFKEADYVKAVICIQRLQWELSALARHFIRQIPSDGRLRYFPGTYNLNAFALAHILDRHYLPDKHPEASKFLISVPEITRLIRVGCRYPAMPAHRPHMYKRVFSAGRTIGKDMNGELTNLVEVVTDVYGYIRSAYPVQRNEKTSIQVLYEQST